VSDINEPAQRVYRDGTDPIDWGIWLAECQIDTRDHVLVARVDNPDAYPLYVLDFSPAATARAIIGRLLDAGWTAPTSTEETQ
jgi:hypothetical protein